MGLRFWVFVVVAVATGGCQRTQSAPSAPAPSVTPIHAVAAPAVPDAPVANVAAPSPAISPAAGTADDDDNEDMDKPWGEEFEIDADANWYFGFAPMNVTFGARPLNGVPPFTYTWDFADGSPTATGDHVEHRYEKLGRYSPFVEGKDGKGETYRVSFLIVVVSREDYAQTKGENAAALKQFPAASPTP
jgi:hypothetical protein